MIFLNVSVFAQGGAAKYASEKEEGLLWHQMTHQQRSDLAPLKVQWREMSQVSKEKWLALSKRMVNMKSADRERIQSRMSQWASLTPFERGQARLQFDWARRIAGDARIEQWRIYNQLSEEDRKRLAARAVPPESSQPVSLMKPQKTPSGAQAQTIGKVNTTPSATVMSPRQVSASVVQAQPGASTRLITMRPSPPPHQPAGQLKISTSVKPQPPVDVKAQQPKLIDPVTVPEIELKP